MQVQRYEPWKRVIKTACDAGVAIPGISASLAYFDTYRRGRMPANLVQARIPLRCTACYALDFLSSLDLHQECGLHADCLCCTYTRVRASQTLSLWRCTNASLHISFAGATRLFRVAYVRANGRQGGLVPHCLGRDLWQRRLHHNQRLQQLARICGAVSGQAFTACGVHAHLFLPCSPLRCPADSQCLRLCSNECTRQRALSS